MLRTAAEHLTRKFRRPLRRPGRRALRGQPATTLHPTRKAERCPALDNARFVLIALVVTGHLLEQLAASGALAAAVYRWIYLFHMPTFVLVSGAVSSAHLTRRRALALLTGLLVPYLVFQTLYPAWDAWLAGSGDWSQGYLTPYWLLWYLPSLACWRLLLPLFARMKWALPLALVIALAAGVTTQIGYPLSLSRTLVFLPLFLLGHRLGAPRLQQLGGSRGRRWAALAILGAAAAGAWYLRDLDPEWLYAASGYEALHIGILPGMATRLALLMASAACALAVLALVPRHGWFAGLGRRSLTAYLTHGFLVRGLLATSAFAWLAQVLPEPGGLLACVVAGAAIAGLLSTRMADALAAPLTRPTAMVRWLASSHPGRAVSGRSHV